MLTIKQVMEMKNVTYNQVMYAIVSGYLKAQKIGWQWFIDEESVKNWKVS